MIFQNHKHNIYDNYFYMSYYIVHIHRVYIMIISYL